MKAWMWIIIAVLLLLGFFTRGYWLPPYAKIKGKANWEEKTFTYDLYLQGKKVNDEPMVEKFGDTTAGQFWESYNKKFQEIVTTTDGYLFITVYKGSIAGVPTSEYDKLTAACVMINFENKTISNNC